MSRRFQFSLGWGLLGAILGAVVGLAICWFFGADKSYWPAAVAALALFLGTVGVLFGDKVVAVLFDLLGFVSWW